MIGLAPTGQDFLSLEMPRLVKYIIEKVTCTFHGKSHSSKSIGTFIEMLEQILTIDREFDHIEPCEVSFAPPQIDSMLLFFNVLVHCHYYLLVFDNN